MLNDIGITQTRPCSIQIFLKLSKMKIIIRIFFDIFLIFALNIDCEKNDNSMQQSQCIEWRFNNMTSHGVNTDNGD